MQAKIKWFGFSTPNWDDTKLQVSIGWEIEGREKLLYQNLLLGSEGQLRRAGAILGILIDKSKTYEIEVGTNERGYEEVGSITEVGGF